MNVPKYIGIGLAMVSGALAASHQSQKGSIQVSEGLIGTADRGISGVGQPIDNAVLLGNGDRPNMPLTMFNGLINGTHEASIALGFNNASQSYIHEIEIEQSKTLTTEEIKKALAAEVARGDFKDRRLKTKDVERLPFKLEQEPHAVKGGIAFEFSPGKDMYVWKAGSIMAVDKQKLEQEYKIESNGLINPKPKTPDISEQTTTRSRKGRH